MKQRKRATIGDAVARATVHQLLALVRGATIDLTDPWDRRRFGTLDPAAAATPAPIRVTVHDPGAYTRILRHGSVGLGESYADGWWDTNDLTGFLRIAHRNLARTHHTRDRLHRVARRGIDPVSRLRRPDKDRDARNIRAHYDLGDDLFQCLLDDTMMYSSAYFASPHDSLETASLAKLDRLAAMLELSPGDRVLEIGTGWGGFAVNAAQRYGCYVTTTTTSERQYRYAQGRVKATGLERLVTVRGDRLSGSGLLALQAIVVPDDAFDRTKHRTDFIKAAIFPGGCLPSVGALTTSADRSGLALARFDDIGVHYAETLRRWRANLLTRGEELASLGYDDRFRRLWEFYFSYCEAGFDERYVSVTQMAFSTPAWRPRPLRSAQQLSKSDVNRRVA